MSHKEFIKKIAARRLIPYFVGGIFTYIPWVLISRNHGTYSSLQTPLFKPLLGLLYGNGHENWLLHNPAIWFLICLFSTEMIFFLINKYLNPWHGFRKYLTRYYFLVLAILLIVMTGAIKSKLSIVRLPWSIDVSFTAIIFLGFGFLLKDFLLMLNLPKKINFAHTLLFLFLILCGVTLSQFNGRVDMNSNHYGNYSLFFVASFSNILIWITISKLIPTVINFRTVGENTLFILIFHRLTFSIITAILVLFKVEPSIKDSHIVFSIIYTAITVTVLTTVSIFLKSKVPILRRIIL